MADLEARFLSKEEYPLWDELAAASPLSSIFEESRWFLMVAEVMECPIEVVGVFDGESLVGGVVLSPAQRFGMRSAVLPPLCPTNSCIVAPRNVKSSAKQEHHLLRVTETLAEFLKSRFSFAAVTNTPQMVDIRSFRWLDFSTNVLYTYQIDLESGGLSSLPGSLRRSVRKAEREGVTMAEEADLDAAQALLDKTHERHGIAAPITRGQLGKLCDCMGETVHVRLAKQRNTDEYLAVLVTVADPARSVSHALLAGFDPAHRRLRAPAWLHWTEIEMCNERGLKTYDMVGADVQSNVDFKSEFEGRLVPYYQVSYASFAYRLAGFVFRG